MNWEYIVTNNGNVTIENLSVTDDQGVAVSCPTTTVAPGASVTCTGSGTATSGQYMNVGTATGTPPGGDPVTASDPSHYFGATVGLKVIKRTNGENANQAPGPYIPVDEPVEWTYKVINVGNVPMENLVVTDDQGVDVDCGGVTMLPPGGSVTCTGSGVATPGQYMNIGTATANPPGGPTVSESDPSHYFGATVGLKVIKRTNGENANQAPGPSIPVGDPVEWTYKVINVGNVPMENLVVTDDQGVDVDCGGVTMLPPGGSVTCTGSGVATPGQYMNIGTATANPPGGGTVTESDPSHYFGEASCTDGYVADEFEHVSYSNNDGDMDWAGPWVEHDPHGGGASSGAVRIAYGRLKMDDYPDSGTSPSIYRSVDLSDYESATLSFDWATSKATLSNDKAVVEISSDGGQNWTILEVFTGTGGSHDANGGSVSYDISDYISADTRIRFRIKKLFGGRHDLFTVDNVRIDKSCTAPQCIVTSTAEHGIWLKDFNGDGHNDRYDFEPGASFDQFPDGTARLTGTVREQGNGNNRFFVDLQLAGLTDVPPPGSPKNDFGADTADWEYYPQWSGTLVGDGNYDGALLNLTRRGPAFQIGTGAADRPGEQDRYGGSGWFDWDVETQAQACIHYGHKCIKSHGIGDVNVRIDCDSGGGSCQDGYVADHFSHVSYDNNDGDMDWLGPWDEHDPHGGGASGGAVRIAYDRLKMDDYPNSGASPSAARAVDLSGYSQASLSFEWYTSAATLSNDKAVIEISSDGGQSWTVLDLFTGTGGSHDANGGNENYDISDYIGADTRIRFRIKKLFGGPHDYFKVDDVRIDKICSVH